MNLFKRNKDQAVEIPPPEGMENRPTTPKTDSLDLVPVATILSPFVVTRDGAFLSMLEIPPLEMSAGESNYAFWAQKYQAALESLPSGTKFQITVLMEPCDPREDIKYFLDKANHWRTKASDPDVSERVANTGNTLDVASQAMIASISDWFDKVRPMHMRSIITLSYQPPVVAVKSLFGGSKNGAIRLDDLRRVMPDVTNNMGQKMSLITQAFGGAGIPLKLLSPGEMCQVIWRSLHPVASGDPSYSARDVALSMAAGQASVYKDPPPADAFYDGMPQEQLRNLLAPDTVIEWQDYLEIDGAFISGFVVNDFRPHQPAFMYRLSDLAGGWSGSMHVEVADPAIVAESLRQREIQLSAKEMTKARQGMLQSYQAAQESHAVQDSRMRLETVGQTPIFIRFFIMRTAPDIETLNDRNQKLSSLLTTIGVRAFSARYDQLNLWKSTFPTMKMTLSQKPRNMTPSSLSTFFWPDRQRMLDDNGVYVGIDEDTYLPIRMDPFGASADRTPSFLTVGRPGAGKSVWLRTMMTSVMIPGGKILAIDLEGEMKEYCQRYGGRYIEVGSSSGERINILDIPPEAENPLAAGTEHLISFFEAAIDQPIPPGPQWNALAEAYQFALVDRGWINPDGKSVNMSVWNHEDAPRLQDIATILERQSNTVGPGLASMLYPYSKGLYSSYFNSPTTFDIRNEQLVVFGLQNVNAHEDSSDRLRVYLWQVMGLIWGEILRRNSVDPKSSNHVMLDEVWALLDAPGGAKAIENMARRFRKRRAALWMATQEVGEFLDSPAGKRILSIVGNTFLMEQKPMESRRLQAAFELSDGMTSLLQRLGTGHGVLHMPQGTVRVFVGVPDDWHVI